MSGSILSPSYMMTNQLIDNTDEFVTPAFLRNIVESAFGSPSDTSSATTITPDTTYRGLVVYCTASTAVTLTVDSGVLSAGQGFTVRQMGAGQVTIAAGSGMTLQSSTGTYATRAQYSLIAVTLYTDGTTLLIDGDLA